MSIWETLVLTTLSIWLCSSFLAQLKNPKILNYDFLNILPTYRFFSPRPVAKDFCIYLRGFENQVSDKWIPLFYNKKKWWCFIWNPQMRIAKAINDFFDQIFSFKNSERNIHISIPYLIILNTATARLISTTETPYTHIQFMIGSHAGFENSNIKILFISNIHKLEAL